MRDFRITLSPFWEKDTVSKMRVEMSLPSDDIEKLHYPSEAFGGRVPFPVYEDLVLQDACGEVAYEIADAPSESEHMTYLGVYPKRKLKGNLSWSYCIFPRILPEGYRSSPYYDFRNEPFGLNGSGYFSFILPDLKERCEVSLRWDMSDMPKGARAIWSYGEGEIHRQLTAQQVAQTMFQVGKMQAVENASIGVYWFGNSGFDIAGVANRILPIFDYMKAFFHDRDSQFHVFLRRDPFVYSGGGSACPYAFISGYSAFGEVDLDQWFRVLVHEMVHTWIHMEDGEENTTWFNEGATEYYSTLIPFWGGFLDASYTASVINDKVNPYYHNVYRETSNEEIAKIQWQDLRAQVIPYGRGFLYLAKVEAALKRDGKGSINDLLAGDKAGLVLSEERWKLFIKERLGEDGLAQFDAMKAGVLQLPEDDLFGPQFEPVEKEIELDGKRTKVWQWKMRE